jgi:hypothetical protein
MAIALIVSTGASIHNGVLPSCCGRIRRHFGHAVHLKWCSGARRSGTPPQRTLITDHCRLRVSDNRSRCELRAYDDLPEVHLARPVKAGFADRGTRQGCRRPDSRLRGGARSFADRNACADERRMVLIVVCGRNEDVDLPGAAVEHETEAEAGPVDLAIPGGLDRRAGQGDRSFVRAGGWKLRARPLPRACGP